MAMAIASMGVQANHCTWSSGVFAGQGIANPLPAGDTPTLLTSADTGFTTDFENRGSVFCVVCGTTDVRLQVAPGGCFDTVSRVT
jgi:hypothetical protein